MDVYFSESKNAQCNLALEEALFADGSTPMLFLYENDLAVVIGRFQNPWRECRIGVAERMAIPIFRRISGGGTVVHGPGNLNWSFLSPHPLTGRDEALIRMMKALGSLGLAVIKNSRHDLLIRIAGEARKISGSAFRQTSRGSLHHATLLVNTNLHVLSRLLDVPPRDMDAAGVLSTSSPVANLDSLTPGLTVDDVVMAVTEEWSGKKMARRISPDDFSGDAYFGQAWERIGSKEWTWDRTPSFTERFAGLPGCRGRVLTCDVRFGRIHEITLGGDGGDLKPLIGRRYNRDEILGAGDFCQPLWLEAFAARVESDGGRE